jgi:hypothetical protein
MRTYRVIHVDEKVGARVIAAEPIDRTGGLEKIKDLIDRDAGTISGSEPRDEFESLEAEINTSKVKLALNVYSGDRDDVLEHEFRNWRYLLEPIDLNQSSAAE